MKLTTFLYPIFIVIARKLAVALSLLFALNMYGAGEVPLRRSISPNQPVWLIHIDTWNYPDPQKIIDLVPEDIRPFVVFNIGLSISGDPETGQFRVAEYGYEIAKSWLRVCAENRVWAVIQHASGGPAQFSDFDLSVYEEFYREYPNLIGFNYSEQFWGYDDPNDVRSPRWVDRINHFANLLELSHQYGGYLIVSWCGNQWNPHINPIGMLKRNPGFEEASRRYTENYILFEKYTQSSYQHDMESVSLGAYLSGYSGQYGIRYDDTGWSNAEGEHEDFTMATQGAVQLEHMMLTGQTLTDGPELIWTQCFTETTTGTTPDGFTTRRWITFPQFDNVSVDLFRKVLDGTVRIPTREEVIDRTKYVVINGVSVGSIDDVYSSPETLFEGLYSFEGNLRDNKNFFKKSGRYPTIPTVYDLDDSLAQSFEYQIDKSDYDSRWPDIASKVSEFDNVFPEEYTGSIYAGRHENAWVIYNPFKTGESADGLIPFKYNTSESVEMHLGEYTAGVMREYSDRITVYLSNFDEYDEARKTDIIKIHGSTTRPTYSYQDRGDHSGSILSDDWTDGVYTLTIQHNGPLDIEILCSGDAVDRLSDYTEAAIEVPALPMAYEGPVQYEGESFDYKNTSGIQRRGHEGSVRNYSGQGYLRFGTDAAAAVKDIATVRKAGEYRLETKYSVTDGNVSTVDLYVNGSKVATPTFAETDTYSDWALNTQIVTLTEGENTVEFRANAAGNHSIYIDSIVLVPTVYGHGNRVQEGESGFTSVDGVVESEHSGYTGNGYVNPDNADEAEVRWTLSFDDSVTKSFTFRYASESDATGILMVNGEIVASRIPFVATGSLDKWDHVNVFASVPKGVAEVSLSALSSEGLPNIDSLELAGGSQWITGTKPFSPIGVEATGVSISEVELSWAAAPGADTYTVKRSSNAAGPFAVVAQDVSETQYLNSGLSELTRYYYVISSKNANGESNSSEIVEALTATAQLPEAPEWVALEAETNDEISVSWETVPSADSYNVKRSYYQGGPYAVVASGVSGTQFKDTVTRMGLIHYYVVSAVNNNGEGDHSEESAIVASTAANLAPIEDVYVRDGDNVDRNFGSDESLAAKEDGNVGSGFNRRSYLKFDVSDLDEAESVELVLIPFQVDFSPNLDFKVVNDDSWVESEMTWNTEPADVGELISNETGFVVSEPFTVDVTEVAKAESAGDGILSIQISQPNSQGQFVGFNSTEAADSSLHPSLVVTFPVANLPPQIPGDFAAEIVSDSQIDLSWSASQDADGYHLQRSLESGGPYNTLEALVLETEYSDTGLAAGTAYFYIVRAVVGETESEYSYEVMAIPSVEISPDEYVFATMEIVAGGRLHLMVANSVLGHRYQILATDDLAYPDWKPIGFAKPGDGFDLLFDIDLSSVETSRFFKMRVIR